MLRYGGKGQGGNQVDRQSSPRAYDEAAMPAYHSTAGCRSRLLPLRHREPGTSGPPRRCRQRVCRSSVHFHARKHRQIRGLCQSGQPRGRAPKKTCAPSWSAVLRADGRGKRGPDPHKQTAPQKRRR